MIGRLVLPMCGRGHGTLNAVTSHAVVPDRREPWRYVVRALFTLAALVAIGYWARASLVLAVLKCDDTCGGADVDHWRWTGQFVLAATGSLLGLVALFLGFGTRFRPAYRALLVVSAVVAMTWATWVIGFGKF